MDANINQSGADFAAIISVLGREAVQTNCISPVSRVAPRDNPPSVAITLLCSNHHQVRGDLP